jgi:hypothetical protein
MMALDPQSKPEDYRPDYVEHENVKYVYERDLGKGAFGFVYLYKAEKAPHLKLAIKVENLATNKSHGSTMTRESYYLRMMNDKGCNRVIGYYGDGFVQMAQYMKLEYVDMTLEDYIAKPDIQNKINIQDIGCQMLECLE